MWEPLLPTVAWCVVGVEMVLGCGLWSGRRWANWGAGGLVAVFLCVLGYGILLGLDIECGCFGPGEGVGSLTLKQAAVVDLVLLATSIGLARSMRRRPGDETGDETDGEEN